MKRAWLAPLVALSAWSAHAQPAALTSWAGGGDQPASTWRVVGLPKQTLPVTRFSVVNLDGERALRVESAGSYGNLVHELHSTAGTLSWSWRIDQMAAGADLRHKASDDTALKVCAMFDLPLSALPFWQRQQLRLARSLADPALPSATLCYVQQHDLPAGTVLPNVYTDRLRWIVLAGPANGVWQREVRDLKADFLRAFGQETPTVPALTAIAIGADTDNTGSPALGFVARLSLQP